MAWEKPDGAKPETKSEFWRPKGAGEVVVGIASSFGESHFGPFVTLEPMVHYPVEGDAKGYGSLIVGLNSWLQKVVRAAEHRGKPLAIEYTGTESTPQGEMRTFNVYVLTPQQWDDEKRKHLQHAPDPDDTPF